jgi:hypothetical protein
MNIDIMGLEMGKFHRRLIWLIVLCLLHSSLLFWAIPSSASPLTEVTLNIPDESVDVDVSWESSGIVSVTGTITCEKWGPDQVKVSLVANSSLGASSVNPANIVFGGSDGSEETRSFSATTRVPPGTSCTEEGVLTVSGIFVQGGLQYDIEPDSVKIIVLQFYQIAVEDEVGRIESLNYSAKAGEDVRLEFFVRNDGNGNDVFLIDMGNRKGLQDRDFDLPVSQEISIAEQVRENIFMDIGIPDDTSGTFQTQVIVISKGAQNEQSIVTYILPVTLKVIEKTISDKIVSFILSPLIIGIVIVIVLVVVIYKVKTR